MIFFENERACMCEQKARKFAITYTYTWFDIFWRIVSWFFRTFSKNHHFWKFWEFLEKGGPRDPRDWLLGKVRVRNSEKWGKNGDLRNKRYVLPQFSRFLPHFRVPQGLIRLSHFPKSSKFPKIMILQNSIKRGFQNGIFFENERACMCEQRDRKSAITYPYTWFDILWWIFHNFGKPYVTKIDNFIEFHFCEIQHSTKW